MERLANRDFFVVYKVPMRQPCELPSSTDVTPSPSTPSSPARGDSAASSSPVKESDGQPRRRRQLPSVPPHVLATSSPPSSPSPKVPGPVQIAILRSSVNDNLSLSQKGCVLLSLDREAATSVAKSAEQYAMVFLCIAVSLNGIFSLLYFHDLPLANTPSLSFWVVNLKANVSESDCQALMISSCMYSDCRTSLNVTGNRS